MKSVTFCRSAGRASLRMISQPEEDKTASAPDLDSCSNGGKNSVKTELPRRDVTAMVASAMAFAMPGAAAAKTAAPVVATTKSMVEIKAEKWLKARPQGGRALVVGLGGEPYWLVALLPPGGDAPSLAPWALKAECTHLGCLAGWRPEMNKYVCACHGSEYDKQGTVLRGPAPRSLGLAKVTVDAEGRVLLSEWEGDDFRVAA